MNEARRTEVGGRIHHFAGVSGDGGDVYLRERGGCHG